MEEVPSTMTSDEAWLDEDLIYEFFADLINPPTWFEDLLTIGETLSTSAETLSLEGEVLPASAFPIMERWGDPKSVVDIPIDNTRTQSDGTSA